MPARSRRRGRHSKSSSSRSTSKPGTQPTDRDDEIAEEDLVIDETNSTPASESDRALEEDLQPENDDTASVSVSSDEQDLLEKSSNTKFRQFQKRALRCKLQALKAILLNRPQLVYPTGKCFGFQPIRRGKNGDSFFLSDGIAQPVTVVIDDRTGCKVTVAGNPYNQPAVPFVAPSCGKVGDKVSQETRPNVIQDDSKSRCCPQPTEPEIEICDGLDLGVEREMEVSSTVNSLSTNTNSSNLPNMASFPEQACFPVTTGNLHPHTQAGSGQARWHEHDYCTSPQQQVSLPTQSGESDDDIDVTGEGIAIVDTSAELTSPDTSRMDSDECIVEEIAREIWISSSEDNHRPTSDKQSIGKEQHLPSAQQQMQPKRTTTQNADRETSPKKATTTQRNLAPASARPRQPEVKTLAGPTPLLPLNSALLSSLSGLLTLLSSSIPPNLVSRNLQQLLAIQQQLNSHLQANSQPLQTRQPNFHQQ